MSEKDRDFIGSIPDVYDDYLVPLIFESYATDLARRTAETSPQRVLETAAGSGVVTRALAPLLSGAERFVASDLNQPMLDRAARRQDDPAAVEWRQADATALPFEDGDFDTVCCQFGVMFYPDRRAGYREARRVLRKGGRFLFNVWDRIDENEFADHVTRAAARLYPDDPPRFLARTPYGYFDPTQIRDEVLAAGFADVELVTVAEISRAPSPRHPAIAYLQGTPLRAEIEARGPDALAEATDRASEALAREFGSGAVEARIQGHVFIATA